MAEPVYEIDRKAVLFYVAVQAALILIGAISLLQPRVARWRVDWAVAHPGPVAYYALDTLFGLWLCAGVYRSRRWALVGMLLYGVLFALQNVYYRLDPHAFLGLLAAGYGFARLAFLGPRPPRPERPPAFLPDRLVGFTYILLNVGSALAFFVHPLPDHPITPMLASYLVADLALVLWSNLGVWGGRGWSVGTGLFFTVMGVLAGMSHPDQRAQIVGAVFGVFYFGIRACGFGPEPRGFLGVRSP